MDFDLNAACGYSPEVCDHYIYANNGQGHFLHSRPPKLAELINDSVVAANINHGGILKIALAKDRSTSVFDGQPHVAERQAVNFYSLAYRDSKAFEFQSMALSQDAISETELPANAFYSAVEDWPETRLLASFDNKSPITISVNDIIVDEGAGFAEFEISLSRAPGTDSVEFEFQTLDETARSGQDYITTSDIITLTGPATSTRISVAIIDDFDVEGTETFSFEISNVIGAVIARSTGLATITENDQSAPENMLSVSDTLINEQQQEAIIKFSLSKPPGQFPVEFSFSTVSDTAIEGEDFLAKSGTRDFSGSETVKYVKIPIINDDSIEQNEDFFVEITNLFNADTNHSTAIVTIKDDDAPKTIYLTIDAVTVDESVGNAVIRFSLSEPPDQDEVEFNFSTLNGTAVDGADFSGESGFRKMTGNETSRFVSVPIFDDDEPERLETFDVEVSNLSGAQILEPIVTSSIVDNDRITNTLSITDVIVNEDSDAAVFTFSLDQAPGQNIVEFNFSTADATAIDGEDYTGKSGYRSMQGPTQQMYLSIPLINDDRSELDETFSLLISNVHGAKFDAGSASATIKDDD